MILTEQHRQAVNEWRGVPSSVIQRLWEITQEAMDRDVYQSLGVQRVAEQAQAVKVMCIEAREELSLGVMEKVRRDDPRFAG